MSEFTHYRIPSNDGSVLIRTLRYNAMNDKVRVSVDDFNIVLDNFRDALEAKRIDRLEGMAIADWFQIFRERVGKEPLFRLYFCFYRALAQSGVGLHEILCEDPKYLIECLANGNYLAYYDKYQLPKLTEAELKRLEYEQ